MEQEQPPKPRFCDAELAEFDGPALEQEDGSRLRQQLNTVYSLMRDGNWRTLDEVSQMTGYPLQSVSARLRDLRKPKFGGYDVQRDRIGKGLFAYRLIVKAEEKAA